MTQTIRSKRPRRARTAAIAAMAVLMLGACAPSTPLTDAEIDRGHQFRPPYQVEHTVHRHLVPVSATNTLIDDRQFRDLYGFLIGAGAQTGDNVVLASRRARLEQRAQVHEFLRRVGLRPETKLIKDIDAGSEDDGYDQVILVRFDRYTPRQNECGKWGEEVKTTFYNTALRNFGCSTTNAIQQQAAFPSSLIEGQLLDFPEGDFAAEAVSRYRGRKIEEIKPETVGGG
jgi:pilus biogenesis lipoprotein CpaD